jgi:2-desacetyl-2-hydroxyethyl bacteriochlorophyllide A dehydrogenase
MSYAASYGGDRTFALCDVDVTPPGPGQVRIEVAYTGICGTDLHIYHGDMDARVGIPAVIGHEMSGILAEIGPGVSDWAVGDAVTVMPLEWCGSCPACTTGNWHICHRLNFLGIDSGGSMQNSWVVPARTLIPVPAGLALDAAALIEPTAVACHDVRRAEISHGEKVLVVGGGPVGLLIAQVAARAGGDVVLAELDPFRRALAKEMGLTVLDPAATPVQDAVAEWTAGAGAEVAFEVSGAPAGVATAVDSLATRGRLVMVAIHTVPRPINLHRFFWRELTLIGARLYDRDDFRAAVDLIASGAVQVRPLISSVQPLSKVGSAFEALQTGAGVMKVLIDCRSSAGTGQGQSR